ncbi:reverse transcriptase domain-containing protein [Idiomarina sp. OT37-5b]|uniref:reverse transcriptase domain-containing protein n=1 Tax=Idiomarina sp. OT37-5b TaxID=2100422 RepID=UPI00131A2B9D|nr:reverse transcriptase domain-containing protein [Idiomarina sp. OT37-5b]
MTSIQKKRSLQEVFLSTFHSQLTFDDFLNLNVAHEYKKVEIQKRVIYIPSYKLKRIHKFLNNTVFNHARFNTDVVFSYRKGISVRDAVTPHAKNKFFFQTDIVSFYQSIKTNDVERALKNQLSDVPISDIDRYIDHIVNLVVVDDHIPAGFATSPVLSNICLVNFDDALLEYCKTQHLTYTRYSDDIIISGEYELEHKVIEIFVTELLKANLGRAAELNIQKTKRYKRGHDFKLLGLNILPNGVVTIPRESKNEIEVMLYLYLTDAKGFDDYVKHTFFSSETDIDSSTLRERGIAKLSGKIISAKSMDNNYISKLRRKYGNTIMEMFIRKSVK